MWLSGAHRRAQLMWTSPRLGRCSVTSHQARAYLQKLCIGAFDSSSRCGSNTALLTGHCHPVKTNNNTQAVKWLGPRPQESASRILNEPLLQSERSIGRVKATSTCENTQANVSLISASAKGPAPAVTRLHAGEGIRSHLALQVCAPVETDVDVSNVSVHPIFFPESNTVRTPWLPNRAAFWIHSGLEYLCFRRPRIRALIDGKRDPRTVWVSRSISRALPGLASST